VLTGVTPQMRAYSEELFGPIAVVYQVDDDDQAVSWPTPPASGSGGAVLQAAWWSGPGPSGHRVETGMIWINHPTSSEPNLPFGGVKDSGSRPRAVPHRHQGVRQPQARGHDAARLRDPGRPGVTATQATRRDGRPAIPAAP
jgi:acyl-CoA reductase-like NAD-dependent aldehyde dehydrogenase